MKVTHPLDHYNFQALSLASYKQFQPAVMECLKTAVTKFVALERRRDENLWLKSMSPEIPDVEAVFRRIIELTSNHGGWELIGQGLFLLLSLA